MASALLSRCSFAVRSTPRAEVQAAARCLAAPVSQSQRPVLLRIASTLPARGICRGYATESDLKPVASLKDALKNEIDFELDNPSEVQVCQKSVSTEGPNPALQLGAFNQTLVTCVSVPRACIPGIWHLAAISLPNSV